MAASHTPAPWEVSSDGVWAKSPLNARVKVATVTIHSPMNGIDWQANAHLIAAAPDLLAAARCLIATHPVFRSKPMGFEGSRARLEQADQIAAEDVLIAAIAKAEGR